MQLLSEDGSTKAGVGREIISRGTRTITQEQSKDVFDLIHHLTRTIKNVSKKDVIQQITSSQSGLIVVYRRKGVVKVFNLQHYLIYILKYVFLAI